MKNLTLTLIDFSSIKLPTYSIIINEPSIHYKLIKRNLEVLEGSNNFELWFDNLLHINFCILYNDISIEESLDLCSSLKKVEESNKELQELIRTWREDESNISTVQKFMINNIIIQFYESLISLIYYDNFFELDSFNSLVQEYKPRLFEISYIKKNDNIKITKEDDAKYLQQMWLKTGFNIVNNGNLSLDIQEDLYINEWFGFYSPYCREFLNEILHFYFYINVEGFELEDNVPDHKCEIEGKNIKFTTDSICEIVEVNGKKVERPYFLNYEDD